MAEDTGTVSPSPARILRTTPSLGASTSPVSLSVATEASVCPLLTASPSLTFHSSMVPSAMVMPSFGISTLSAILSSPPDYQSSNLLLSTASFNVL